MLSGRKGQVAYGQREHISVITEASTEECWYKSSRSVLILSSLQLVNGNLQPCAQWVVETKRGHSTKQRYFIKKTVPDHIFCNYLFFYYLRYLRKGSWLLIGEHNRYIKQIIKGNVTLDRCLKGFPQRVTLPVWRPVRQEDPECPPPPSWGQV